LIDQKVLNRLSNLLNKLIEQNDSNTWISVLIGTSRVIVMVKA